MTTATPDVLALRSALAHAEKNLDVIALTLTDHPEYPMKAEDVNAARSLARFTAQDIRAALIAAVRAETLAGSGVVHEPVLFDPTGPVYDSLPHPKASRYEMSVALLHDQHAEPLEDPDAYDRRILLVTIASAARALAATPPTPALTATRLAEALHVLWSKHPEDGCHHPDGHRAEAEAILGVLATSPAPGEVEP